MTTHHPAYTEHVTLPERGGCGHQRHLSAPKRKRGHASEPAPAPLGLRWRVERTNSWLSNYGQLRRNTDRKPEHRAAQLALAVTLIITLKLIDHHDRWQPR